jgi:hypothetical protein
MTGHDERHSRIFIPDFLYKINQTLDNFVKIGLGHVIESPHIARTNAVLLRLGNVERSMNAARDIVADAAIVHNIQRWHSRRLVTMESDPRGFVRIMFKVSDLFFGQLFTV